MPINLLPTYCILLGAFAVIIGIQLFLVRRVKESEDYALAGRSLGILPLTCLVSSGAIFGAITLGTAELAYSVGISAAWYSVFGSLVLALIGAVLAPRFRRAMTELNAVTMPELLERWFGSGMRQVYAWVYIPVCVVFLGGAVAGSVGPLVSMVTGLGAITSKVLSLLVFASLIFVAGYMGAAWQAVAQATVLVVGCAAAFWISQRASGGWSHALAVLPHNPYFSLSGMGWKQIATLMAATAPGMIYDQFFWQMAASARDDRSVRGGFVLGALIFGAVGILCTVIGVGFAAYKPGVSAPLEYIPRALISMSAIGGGLFVAGVLLSNISTGTVTFICTATVLVNDLYAKIRGKDLPKAERLWVMRGMVLMYLLLCVLFTIFVPGQIIGYFVLMFTFGASIAWPVLAGLYRDKLPWITGTGCVWGTILGFVTAVLWGLVLNKPFGLDAIFPTLGVSLIGNVVTSLIETKGASRLYLDMNRSR